MFTYVHYKGGRYLRLFTAETHDHNGDVDVVYVSLKYGKAVTRPLNRDSRGKDAWSDVVDWPDGVRRQRFTLESMLSATELEKLRKIWGWGIEEVTDLVAAVNDLETQLSTQVSARDLVIRRLEAELREAREAAAAVAAGAVVP
jgi:hypothetical protein